jgi:hypothetical protein
LPSIGARLGEVEVDVGLGVGVGMGVDAGATVESGLKVGDGDSEFIVAYNEYAVFS